MKEGKTWLNLFTALSTEASSLETGTQIPNITSSCAICTCAFMTDIEIKHFIMIYFIFMNASFRVINFKLNSQTGFSSAISTVLALFFLGHSLSISVPRVLNA